MEVILDSTEETSISIDGDFEKNSYSKDIKLSFDDAEYKVKEALMKIGFGILTEINMKDAFKAKLDLDYKNYT